MSDTIESTSYEVNKPDISAEDFKSEILAVDLKTGSYYSLRGGAVPFWRLLMEGTPVGMAIRWLAAGYDMPGQNLAVEILPFVEQLEQARLIVPVPPAASFDPSIAPDWLKELPPFEKPILETYTEMQDLLMLDPIHDVDAAGWPPVAAAETQGPDSSVPT